MGAAPSKEKTLKFTVNNKQIAVIDDFLPAKDWEEVHKYMELTSYISVWEQGWNGSWRLDDGPVMRGPSTSYGDYSSSENKYPTGVGLDILMKAVLDNAPKFSKQLGAPDSWNAFTALPMLYPRNTGLYWHRDAPTWAGSYTYYAHKQWNIEWGGEMLIGDESTNEIPDEYGLFLSKEREAMGLKQKVSFGAHIDNSKANEFIMEQGIGSFVMPKPNRLVIVSQGTMHTASKVNPAAGDNLRMSISGFFQKQV